MKPEVIDLSIVIPAYQEEKRIGKSLDKLSIFLKENELFNTKNVEVLVVAADSTDRTDSIVLSKRLQFNKLKLLKPGPRSGKGRDVQFGIVGSVGKNVVFMDADLSTPLNHLVDFYNSCEEGIDVVVGTRNLLKHHPAFPRRIISNAGNVLFRAVSGVWIEDSQCGFKMFNRNAGVICFSKLSILGWGFDMEILTIAKTNQLKMKTYRINDWTDSPYSTFTDNVPLVVLRSLFDLGRIFINRISGRYLYK